MAYIFLMGGGFAASIASCSNRTPKGKRLIDNDLILLTLPMLISGTIFGVNISNQDNPDPSSIRRGNHNSIHFILVLRNQNYIQVNAVKERVV